jgi:tetratricopeptide (TPR) repeat protein
MLSLGLEHPVWFVEKYRAAVHDVITSHGVKDVAQALLDYGIQRGFIKSGEADFFRKSMDHLTGLHMRNEAKMLHTLQGFSRIAFRDGDMDTAIEVSRIMADFMPDQPDLCLNHAGFLQMAGRMEEAEKEMRFFLQEQKSIHVQYGLAQLLMERGKDLANEHPDLSLKKYYEARLHLKMLVETNDADFAEMEDPESVRHQCMLDLGLLHLRLKQYEEAKNYLAPLRLAHPENKEIKAWLGQAVTALVRAEHEFDPGGTVATAENDEDESLVFIFEKKAADEQVANTRGIKDEKKFFGLLRESLDKLTHACQAKEAALVVLNECKKLGAITEKAAVEYAYTIQNEVPEYLDDKAGTAEIMNMLARDACYGHNALDSAVIFSRYVRDLYPEEPQSHINLGLYLLQKGNFRAARQSYENAREVDPEDPEIVQKLGKILFEQSQKLTNEKEQQEILLEAEEIYRQAVEMASEKTANIISEIKQAAFLKNEDDVEDLELDLLEAENIHAECFLGLAETQKALGYTSEAEENCYNAAEAAHDNPSVLCACAKFMLEYDELQAEIWLKEAMKCDENCYPAYEMLYVLYEGRRDWESCYKVARTARNQAKDMADMEEYKTWSGRAFIHQRDHGALLDNAEDMNLEKSILFIPRHPY